MIRTRNRTLARKSVVGIFVLDMMNDIEVKFSRNNWFVGMCVGEINNRYIKDMIINLSVGMK